MQMKELLFPSLVSALIQLLMLIRPHGAAVTQSELREKYGQGIWFKFTIETFVDLENYSFLAGTTFNDGKSCYRTCNGQTKTCYYEFHAQMYDTMSE